MMSRIKTFFYLFLIGFTDSISPYWLKHILFAMNPITKQIHPSSYKLFHTFKNAFIQVIVLLIGLPAILDYLDLDFTANILKIMFLLLSYGYLFFYNIQVMKATKQIQLWARNFPNNYYCKIDIRENFDTFYEMSNLIKNFIFLILYYTPLNLILMIISLYFPLFGSILLVISQSFFNATFYYLQKWPYDRFNIAFIEKNVGYMLGYGFTVSFMCNIVFQGINAIAVFFIVSLWMMINCQLYSPPAQDSFSSFAQVWECMKSAENRATLPNAFNIHRERLRNNKQYSKDLLKNMKIVKPALLLTEYLNKKLGKRLKNKAKISQQQAEKKRKQQQQQKQQENIILSDHQS